MFKTLGKIIKWLAFSLVLCVAALFLINQFDETLQPEVAALLQPPISKVPPEQNAFFTLVGLSAPSGVNAAAWGERYVREQAVYRPAIHSGVASPKSLCDLEGNHCLRLAHKQPEVLKQALLERQELNARYLAARALPHVAEVIEVYSVEAAIPNFPIMLRGQELRFAQIGLWVEAGKMDEVMAELGADIAFARRWCAGAQSLLGKMIASAMLQRDYVLLADLMREKPALMASQHVRMGALLTPLTPTELSMLSSIRTEFLVVANWARAARTPQDVFLSTVSDSPAWLARIQGFLLKGLFLPNASINMAYQSAQINERMARASPQQLAQVHREVQEWVKQLQAVDRHMFYNPAGKWVLKENVVDFNDYVRRPMITNVFIQLLTLQQQIVDQHIPDAAIPAFLAASPLRNPFDGNAVEWDAPRHELFIPMDSTGEMRYSRFGKGHHRVAVPL